MKLGTFLALVAFAWIARELIVGTYTWLSRRHIRRDLRAEKIRGLMGESRNQLVTLAIHQKIDINSETFRALYPIQTFILRRPDQYDEIADWLRRAFLSYRGTTKTEGPLDVEARVWTPEIRMSARKMAEALDLLVFDASPKRRHRWAPLSRHEPESTRSIELASQRVHELAAAA